MAGKLPNLIVIGAMKCGTTSLHDYLNMHPDIFMSDPKEIDYFSGENSGKTLDWYTSHFDTDRKICGESSQNYSKAHYPLYAPAPKRMSELIPDAKLIYIVRDPIERYRSHILENFYGEPPEEIESNKKMNSYVKTGMYYYQLSAFLEYYKLTQIKVVVLEELQVNRLKVMNEIFDFLGSTKLDNEDVFNYVSNDHMGKGIPYRVRVSVWYRILNKLSPAIANRIGSSSRLKSLRRISTISEN